MIDILNKIFAIRIWSQLDKFLIIVSIVNQNCWNLVSLFSGRNISFERINIWFTHKLEELGKENLQPRCRFIFDQFSIEAKYSHNIVQDSQFQQLPALLKVQFLLTQLPRQFVIIKQHQIHEISRFISQNIPGFQKNRILTIYFYFFGMFHQGYGNIQQCEYICEIFKRNLLSNYLFEKLIFVRISRLHLISAFDEEYKEIIHLINVINP